MQEDKDKPKYGGTMVNYLLRSPIHFSPLEVTTFIVAWPFQNLHSQLFYYAILRLLLKVRLQFCLTSLKAGHGATTVWPSLSN